MKEMKAIQTAPPIQIPREESYEQHQERMTRAFRKVANQENWKNHVNALIDAPDSEFEEISDAVIHFTGSIPHFTRRKDGKVRVRAAGYYSAVGA